MSISKVFLMQTVFIRILLQRENLYKIYIYDLSIYVGPLFKCVLHYKASYDNENAAPLT